MRRNGADIRLVTELTSRPITVEHMVDLFAGAFGGPHWTPRRRAIKATHRLAHGAVLHHVTDLVILGELLPGEDEIAMVKFLTRYPLPEDETVTPKGAEAPVKKREIVPCASGAKCMWARRGKPAPAVGRSKYCTKVCAQSDLARQSFHWGVWSHARLQG